MTIMDFILARIGEDEAIAECSIDRHPLTHAWEAGDPADCDFATRWNPWRVLATCATRRQIVWAHRAVPDRDGLVCASCAPREGQAAWPCDTLHLLSQEWVEHADYRYEWVRAARGSREYYP